MSDYSSIPVREDTKTTLDEEKRDDESWDDFLKRLSQHETGEGYDFAPSPTNPNPGSPGTKFEDYGPEDSEAALERFAEMQEEIGLVERMEALEKRLDDFETELPRRVAENLAAELR